AHRRGGRHVDDVATANADDVEHLAQSVRVALDANFETLTSPQLGRMLRSLDAKDRLPRFVTAQFDVTPATQLERQLHNVNESTAAWTLGAILVLGAALACALGLCCMMNRRA